MNAPSTASNSSPERIQELIEVIDQLPDRAVMRECLQAVLALHGAGLEKILQLSPAAQRDQFSADPLVRGLLLIHGLHPVPLDARVQQALEKVLPYIRSHGGDVQLVSLDNGVATLRLQGTCKTCAASAVTLELAVKAALNEFCPDLLEMKVEGVAPPDDVERECVTP